jgi:hypothetical protein
LGKGATVVIAEATVAPRLVAPSLVDSQRTWAYLGPAAAGARIWRVSQRDLGFTEIVTGPLIEAAAERLRQPYLEWVDQLDSEHADLPGWWFNRISERNSMLDPFFLEVCSLGAARDLLESAEPPALIVAGSSGLATALVELVREHGLEPELKSGRLPGAHGATEFIRAAAAIGYFCADGLLLRSAALARRLRGQRPKPAPTGRAQALLMTFFGEAQVRGDASYIDAYFPGLKEWLERRGFETWTYPFFTSRRRLLRKYSWLTRTGEPFLIPEDWLTIRDYVAALVFSFRLLRMPRAWGKIDGLDVSPLVRQARRRQAADNGPRLAILVSRFPARLAAARFRPAHVIAWAENQIHDKALFIGCKQAFPEACRTGVQNTPLFPNLTNSFRLPTESRRQIGGDRVATSGPLPAEILSKASAGSLHVVSACGLRYSYLRGPARRRPVDRPQIVVALPLIVADATDLLQLVLPVCKEMVAMDWIFKSHPHHPFAQAAAAAGIGALPAHARVVQESLGEHLRSASALVTTGSGTALEAAALGIPVVVTASREGLTFDPLAWFDAGRSHAVRTSAELATTLRACLTPQGLHAAAALGQTVLDGWFAPVDEAGLGSLIG